MVAFGPMLKRLRKSKGLTQEDVGKALKVARQTVGAWEKGESEPTAGQLYLLARLLEVPLEVFLETAAPNIKFLFRADNPDILDEDAKRIAIIKATYYAECERMFGVFASLPECRTLNDYLPEVIEDTADQIRDWLGVEEGPLHRPIDAVARKGIKVFFLDLPNEVSGFSAYSEEIGAAVFANLQHPLERKYNTLFHEIGHLVFHRRAYSDGLTTPTRAQEKIAAHFAGAVLFPREAVILELGRFARRWIPEPVLDDIKLKYQISKRTALTRAMQVGLIDKKQYGQQLGKLNQKYGKNEEKPVLPDGSESRENRHLIEMVLRLLILEEITMSRAAEVLGLSLGEVEKRYAAWLKGEEHLAACD